jgi:hypothetical protein
LRKTKNPFLTYHHLLLIVILSFQNNLQNKPLFLISSFQQIMNGCEFEEIIVSGRFKVENGIVGLERDVYLSIVQFLDSTVLRKV